MIPFVVFLAGFLVCGLCLWVLWKPTKALWDRKLREAMEEDKKTFIDDDKVG